MNADDLTDDERDLITAYWQLPTEERVLIRRLLALADRIPPSELHAMRSAHERRREERGGAGFEPDHSDDKRP